MRGAGEVWELKGEEGESETGGDRVVERVGGGGGGRGRGWGCKDLGRRLRERFKSGRG
jgi:hypothetical protein